MLRISVLGSGSGGNSAVIFTDDTRLLIDAGLSAKQLKLRLGIVGIDPESLDGVLITHEHGDHVRGLDVFCRTVQVPLYSNAMTREVMMSGKVDRPKTWRIVPTGGRFKVGDIEVQTFPVAHDATEPMGFALRDSESAIGVLSDVGYVTNLMRNHMQGMNTIFVEANYDVILLQNDTKRPWSTKQRILSRHGHLSNDQTAELLGEVGSEQLHRVILGHLSQDCNEPQMAIDVMQKALEAQGHSHVVVECARQDVPTECHSAIPGWEPEPGIVEADPESEAIVLVNEASEPEEHSSNVVRQEAARPEPEMAFAGVGTPEPEPWNAADLHQGELF